MDTIYVIMKRIKLNGYDHYRFVVLNDDVCYTPFADEATTFFSAGSALFAARELGLFGYEIAEGKNIDNDVTVWTVLMEVKEDVD